MFYWNNSFFEFGQGELRCLFGDQFGSLSGSDDRIMVVWEYSLIVWGGVLRDFFGEGIFELGFEESM